MSSPLTAHLTERQQYWLNHLRACDRSGQTTIDYAREHGVSVRAMYSARKALVKKGTLPPAPSSLFQPVQVVSTPDPREGQWQIQLPNGSTVSFAGTIDAATLALVLNTAAALS